MNRCLPLLLFCISIASACNLALAQCNGTFYPNPLSSKETPDPGVLRVGSTIYTYNTSGCESTGAFPIRSSGLNDRTAWTQAGSVFKPRRYPSWASSTCNYWAPEVFYVQGRYVCYFTSMSRSTGRMCIGAATCSSPTGPFTDLGAPLLTDSVDLIDPSYFVDPASKRTFLLFKKPSGIYIAEMQASGTSVIGQGALLLARNQAWEGVNVEAPSLIYNAGTYLLFYSGNVYTSSSYGVGVAQAAAVTGPYTKFSTNPILRSNSRFNGPGHQFLFQETSGKWTMFYHARDNSTGLDDRVLMSDAVTWGEDGWPRVNDGTPSVNWGGCDYILDNSNAAFTASANWSTGSSAVDKFGPDYRYHLTASVTDPAQWSCSVSPGTYLVSAWWSQGANRSASAPYILPNGTVVRVNQQSNGGAWNSLGTAALNGSAATKLSCWTTLNYIVLADAIRYKQVGR